jgi:hypothetical protein
MRRSTWDSPSADLGSKLILEGSNIFPGPQESFRAQRESLKHMLLAFDFISAQC